MSMNAETVCSLLGRWTSPEEMLSASLADGIAELISTGAIPRGAQLPSRRQLGRALGVSHNTVSTAYELLEAQGTVDHLGTVGAVLPADLPL